LCERGLTPSLSLWPGLCGTIGRCVFDGLQPNLYALMSTIREEMRMWGSAGARGVSFLLAQLPYE
jgi:hypothetical protein